MNSCAFVATHHKTGTSWMWSTFRAICGALDIPIVQVTDPTTIMPKNVKAPLVVFNGHGFKDAKSLIELPQSRVFHLIRDPRDMIISATHYHRVAKEKWLHNPRPKLGGLTYQQKLNSFTEDKPRYLLEMDRFSRKAMNVLLNWDYSRPENFECKYEDLIVDTDMALFTRIVTHLGFSDDELEQCREEYWDNSIFGGKASAKSKTKNVHVRSGDPRQWPKIFDRELGAAFVERFDDALVRLGYEPDNSWVDRLPAG